MEFFKNNLKDVAVQDHFPIRQKVQSKSTLTLLITFSNAFQNGITVPISPKQPQSR